MIIPWSGVPPAMLHFLTSSHVCTVRRVVSLSYTIDVVPHTRTQPLLKHSALTRATAMSPATSHTQMYQRKGLSSLSLPCPVSRARKRGTVTTEHLDFRHQGLAPCTPSAAARPSTTHGLSRAHFLVLEPIPLAADFTESCPGK